jgi:PAS domain S-box-containing protein
MEISESIYSILNQKPVLIWMNKIGMILQTSISLHKPAFSSEVEDDNSLVLEGILPEDITLWIRSIIRDNRFIQAKKQFSVKKISENLFLDVQVLAMDDNHFSIIVEKSPEKQISHSSGQQKEEMSRLLMHLASDFMSIDEQKLDSKIQEALKMIGLFARADRSYILIHDLKNHISRNTHEWVGPGIHAEIENLQNIKLEHFEDFLELHRKGKVFYIPSIDALKNDNPQKAHFQAQQIKSLLVLPLSEGNELIGAVGFDAVNKITSWNADELTVLEFFASILSKIFYNRSITKSLRKSEEQYRILAENMQDLVSWHDEKFIFQYVSPSFQHVLGFTSDELLNQPAELFVHPEDLIELRKSVKEEIDQKGSAYTEYRQLTKSGDYIWLESITKRVEDNSGNLIRYQTVSRDRTQQKATEQALKHTEDKYRSIFNSIQDIYYETNKEGFITDISPSIARHSGYQVHEILGKSSFFFYEDSSIFEKLINTLKVQKEVIDFEVQLRTKDKRVIYVSLNAQLIFGSDGIVTGTRGTMRDITERKLAKQELELSEARLKQTQITAKVGSWELDPSSMLISWSDELYALTGIDRKSDNITLDQQLEIVFPEDRPIVLRALNQLMSKKEQMMAEFRVHLPNGKNRYIKILANPILSDDHKIAQVLGTAMDITEIRTAEKALQKERDLFIAGPVVSMVWHNKTGWPFEFVSKNAIVLTGYSSEELIKDIEKYEKLIHPDDLDRVHEETNAFLAEGKKYWQQTYRIIRKDGKVRWITDYVIVQSIREGVILKTRGYLLDQTDKILTEQKLAASNRLLKKVTDHIPGFIFQYVLNQDGSSSFPYASEGIRDIYELSPEDVKDDAAIAFERKHPDDLDNLIASIRESGLQLKTWNYEYRVILPFKGLRWLRGNAAPELMENGSVLWHGFIMDITDRKAEEEEIILLNKRLTQRNKELEQYAFMASHDLRGPVANLMSLVKLFNRVNHDDPRNTEILEGIDISIHQLNQTLHNMLEVLKLRQSADVPMKSLDLNEIYQSAILNLHTQIKESNAKIKVNFEVKNLYYVHSHIESLFHNMISNSIRYAHPSRTPEIEILSEVHKDEVILRFRDNGLGINLDRYKDRLFGMYQRFHVHPDSRGLGLYIIHSQIQSLGGRIEVESIENEGTTFIIYLKPPLSYEGAAN